MKRITAMLVAIALTIIVIPSSAYAGTMGLGTLVPKRFSSNLALDGVELSGYTYPVAYMKFNLENQKLLEDYEVKLALNGKTVVVNSEDIDFKANTLERLQQIWIAQTEGYSTDTEYSSTYSYSSEKLEAIANKLYNEVCTIPVDTREEAKGEPVFSFETRTFTSAGFVPAVIGYSVSYEDFLAEAESAVNEAIFTSANHTASLDLKTDPVYSVAPVLDNYGVIGTYTTHTTNVVNRNTNIRVATEALTNRTLVPGEEFSYNGSLGNTTPEKGYKVAGILVNGKPSSGIGGGICQVSSTMYNAVLEAGMKVTERHPHSASVGYVPKGRDATVSYGSLDFKWQNNTSSKVYMTLSYNDRVVNVTLYGKQR
ncbi:MAG: VanW family protein [Clostridiales bacterium]|jgi:vancomycin resistance protein YoaR|nr:VanW family protein [Clostridiales bacterium]MDR2751765.1 VanW family protein [Clostridiales bacterium]